MINSPDWLPARPTQQHGMHLRSWKPSLCTPPDSKDSFVRSSQGGMDEKWKVRSQHGKSEKAHFCRSPPECSSSGLKQSFQNPLCTTSWRNTFIWCESQPSLCLICWLLQIWDNIWKPVCPSWGCFAGDQISWPTWWWWMNLCCICTILNSRASHLSGLKRMTQGPKSAEGSVMLERLCSSVSSILKELRTTNISKTELWQPSHLCRFLDVFTQLWGKNAQEWNTSCTWIMHLHTYGMPN